MSRVDITQVLKGICRNVSQVYPDFVKDYPLLIYKLDQTGKASHDSIEYFTQSLTVEIYTETSEERSELEIKVIKELFNHGWINNSSVDMSIFNHYRQILSFERNE